MKKEWRKEGRGREGEIKIITLDTREKTQWRETVLGQHTCDVDFMVVGVLGERGPCDEEGELEMEFISSSLPAIG